MYCLQGTLADSSPSLTARKVTKDVLSGRPKPPDPTTLWVRIHLGEIRYSSETEQQTPCLSMEAIPAIKTVSTARSSEKKNAG